MELAVVILSIALAIVAMSAVRRSPSSQNLLEPGAVERRIDGDALDIQPKGGSFELQLHSVPLLDLKPVQVSHSVQRTPILGSHSMLLGTILDNPRMLEFLAGQRWILAEVPEAIRQGGSWVKAADGAARATARGGAGRFAGHAKVVTGGAATGTAVALGPALVGAAAVAYAHHTLEASVRRVDERLQAMDLYRQDSEMGVVIGARELVAEMAEWGAPHLWPDQLKYELAVRRAALDPICYALRREVERAVAATVKSGVKFTGMSAEDRAEMTKSFESLLLVDMTKAQLSYATTMVLLDSENAPFGLERLDRVSEEFVGGLQALSEELQAAIDGERPKLSFMNLHRSRHTEPLMAGLIDELERLRTAIRPSSESELLLSVDENGSLELALPLDSGEAADQHSGLDEA